MPTFDITGSGGVQASSSTTFGGLLVYTKRVPPINGGCKVWNLPPSTVAQNKLTYLPFQGGIVVGGTSVVSHTQTPTGGAELSGTSDNSVNYLITGNCIVNGSATVNAVYNIYQNAGQFITTPLPALVSGKAIATAEVLTDYFLPESCADSGESGSIWLNKTRIIAEDASYVTTTLDGSGRSTGLNCYFNFSLPSNCSLLGAAVKVIGKWHTSLPDAATHQVHLLANGNIDSISIGSDSYSFINPLGNQTISFGDIDDPVSSWVYGSTNIPSSVINSDFGITYYFISTLDDSCFIDTVLMKIKYALNINV